jgi:hypothetical protein
MTAKRKRPKPIKRPKSSARKSPSILNALTDLIRRYVVMTDEQLLVTAIWVVQTHCIDSFEQTPYLAVVSPEKQCGKSRLLEVLELLVRKPWMAIVPSEAVVFRRIHSSTPTLLLDEVDTIFKQSMADRYEGLRAILNAGHRRGSKVPRCVGPDQEIEEFNVFCPKVLAGIGPCLPETVADRSIPIHLKRRSGNEPVERFRRRDVVPTADDLRKRIERWAKAHKESLRDARPTLPDELSDRAQEGCEGLVAIANALGVGEPLRAALVVLLTEERADDQESIRLRLLRDVQAVFVEKEARLGRRVTSVSTEELLKRLDEMDEAPWASYCGRGIEARDLAQILAHYDVRSTTIRIKGQDKPRKGYKQDDLHDAWSRYLQ